METSKTDKIVIYGYTAIIISIIYCNKFFSFLTFLFQFAIIMMVCMFKHKFMSMRVYSIHLLALPQTYVKTWQSLKTRSTATKWIYKKWFIIVFEMYKSFPIKLKYLYNVLIFLSYYVMPVPSVYKWHLLPLPHRHSKYWHCLRRPIWYQTQKFLVTNSFIGKYFDDWIKRTAPSKYEHLVSPNWDFLTGFHWKGIFLFLWKERQN